MIRPVVAVDTTGPVIGVAVWGPHGLYTLTERVRRGSEALLVPWTKSLCADAGCEVGELGGVAVATGPGAFTGLRVGMAHAIGLASALDIPVWPCSSLLSRFHASGVSEALVMLDARMGRVYAALYVDGEPSRGPLDVPPEEAISWAGGRDVLVTGEGALVYEAEIVARGAHVSDDAASPGVEALARLGVVALANGQGISCAEVQPCYLRPADAIPPRGGRIRRGSA